MYESRDLKNTAPNAGAGDSPEAGQRSLPSSYGLFVHLVPSLTVDSVGGVTSLATLCAEFDVQVFVADLVEFGVEYVRFTAWHQGMFPLYPSSVMSEWRGRGTSAERDIIGELIEHLRGTGIALQLYTHPRDGHDMSREDQERTGWGSSAPSGSADPDRATFDFSRWNDFVAASYEELLDRYGPHLQSIYFDEGSEQADSEWVVDYGRLRSLIRAKAPGVVLQQNFYGNLYGLDVADHEYYRWGEFASLVGRSWPGYRSQSVSVVVGSLWWAADAASAFAPGYSAADLFRYLVLQVSVNQTGGGLALAAGPFPDGGWEHGVRSLLVAVNNFLRRVRRSVVGTRPSELWRTPDKSTVASVGWGVATEDDEFTYLHIFEPVDGELSVPLPRNGTVPTSAKRVDTGETVLVEVVDDSLLFRGPSGQPDAVDTVLQLLF